MPTERLQKILAKAGIASRRKAEALILEGHVKVNGKVIQELGVQADSQVDQIEVKGKLLRSTSDSLNFHYHYYAYYKPRGLVVTKRDELGRQDIFAKLPLPPQVNTVGRLDKNSEGLLLLSDDGDFIYQYTHPRFQIAKVYQVQTSRLLVAGELRRLLRGIFLDGKLAKAHQVKVWEKNKEYWLELELREGMKREIRRTLEILGVKVLRLIRVQHGSVSLERMRFGELKVLTGRPK